MNINVPLFKHGISAVFVDKMKKYFRCFQLKMETTVFTMPGSQYNVKIEKNIGEIHQQLAQKTGLSEDKIRICLIIRLEPDNPDEFKKLLYTIQRNNDSDYVDIDGYIKTIFKVLAEKHPLLAVEHDADTTKIYESQYIHKNFKSSVFKEPCDTVTKFLPDDMTLEELVPLMHRYLKRSYLCMVLKLSHPENTDPLQSLNK